MEHIYVSYLIYILDEEAIYKPTRIHKQIYLGINLKTLKEASQIEYPIKAIIKAHAYICINNTGPLAFYNFGLRLLVANAKSHNSRLRI